MKKAFTLIELLIVIAIIAILTVAFLPTLRGGQAKARDAAKKSLLADLSVALENEINEGRQVPADTFVAPNATLGSGTCVYGFASAPGDLLASALGRVPQTFPMIGSASGSPLCNTGASTFWYNQVGPTEYVLAIEVENVSSANVITGTPADNTVVSGINDKATYLARTASAGPNTGSFYYVVGKFN